MGNILGNKQKTLMGGEKKGGKSVPVTSRRKPRGWAEDLNQPAGFNQYGSSLGEVNAGRNKAVCQGGTAAG